MALIETGRETIGGPVSTGKHILVIDSTCNVPHGFTRWHQHIIVKHVSHG
jgi:hypothetical protein